MVTMSEHTARFVKVATVGDLGKARILATRLGSEGIEVRVHSEALGPYPVTVGDLATAELWVMSDRVADAEAILLDADVQEVVGAMDTERGIGLRSAPSRLVAAVLAVIFLLAVALRLMQVY